MVNYQYMMSADDVARELNCSKSHAYTEELKASDQMKWVGLINNVRSSAEEIVMRELIYV